MTPSYGSISKEEVEPETATSFMTESKLIISSPGLWLVIIYAAICNHFNDAVSVNIRPLPGEYLNDGEFMKNPEYVHHFWNSYVTTLLDRTNTAISLSNLIRFDYPVLPTETFPYVLMIKLCYGIPFVVCALCWLLNPIAGDMRASVVRTLYTFGITL